MNNTTNTRFAISRKITALRLVSLSLGFFLIAAVPTIANAQKETLPTKPIQQPNRETQNPIEKKGIDEKPVEALPALTTVSATTTLPKEPANIGAMTVKDIVDYKLELIAADIQHLKDRIKDRQARENDITTGKVAGANAQLPGMKADDQSDQNQINGLDAEAKAIPKMRPKQQLQVARANFNSHLTALRANKSTAEGQVKQIKQRPPNRVSLAALNAAQSQVDQDDKDIKTLTELSNAAAAQISLIK